MYRRDGLLVAGNRLLGEFFGLNTADVIGNYSVLQDPEAARAGTAERHERIFQGERIELPPVFYDMQQLDPSLAQQLWVTTTEFPLYNDQGAITHRGIIYRDVTKHMQDQQAVEHLRNELTAQQQEISEQRHTIRELSTPVIQLWEGIITMPLVGEIDARRATSITENLLEAIVEHQADSVILDITGVAMVDTAVANYLISATRACRLLGSQVVLVGIGAEIAHTLVNLGLDMSGIVTMANLRAGIIWAFERQGLEVVSRQPAMPGS
jgi:anti-anti-sigma factor